MSRVELMAALGLSDRKHFAGTYLHPGIDAGLVEMTLPDSPRNRKQKYRLTVAGRQVQDSL
ncbi:MAG: cell filamentation protein Fic [Caldilineaceae bacterium SB0668_bin_21]|nr:cell filamentation protein Fic [Caldilineaceae bacterium SB0668_bin_21]MYC23425.1 cell filamentation protein Fic [Caldilineaceae bacterium SB0662_bin_25]